MYKKLLIGIAIVILGSNFNSLNARGIGSVVCFAEPPLAPFYGGFPEDWVSPGYFETMEVTYTKKTCKAGYRKLKKAMRQAAARYCRNTHASPRYNPLQCLDYNKISCEKIRRPHHSTTVKVKVRLYTYCR